MSRPVSYTHLKAADLVLLDRDPTAVPPEDIRGIRVLETIKNGVRVFQA